MCGIAGIVSERPIKVSVIKAMTDSIRHRGPDGEGYLMAGKSIVDVDPPGFQSFRWDCRVNIAFGHRRLAIQDLSAAGIQPMAYHNRYHIVFNGEIYNFPELAAELKRYGYLFASQTDTEVILAAYDRWGTECLQKFNGMWAFAILDRCERTLFLARDRFGIKPLYYFRGQGFFAFASEIKALLLHPDVATQPNREYCLEYLKRGAREFGPATAFENIYRFPHAAYSRVGLDRLVGAGLEAKTYWRLLASESNASFDAASARDYARRYYAILEDAVRIRLRADVKVGSALSGGLDSASIVYLVNQQLRRVGKTEQQETFSSVHTAPQTQYCDESRYINELAAYLGVASNQIEPHVADIIEEHRTLIYTMDTPPESTCMSSWYTYKCVGASDVTVTLDGQGADEQLAGYLSYLMPFAAQLPFASLLSQYSAFSKIPGARVWILRGAALNVLRRCISTGLTRRLCRLLGVPVDPFRPVNRILLDDTLGNLLTLIHYSDREAMAHSVESRMPFMDYRLTEFLAALPVAYKIHDGWTKYIARLAFDGRLPDKICWRKDKMGWPIPEKEWFRGPLKEWLCRTVEDSAFLRELGVGENIRRRVEKGEPVKKMVRLLNLAVWHTTFFADDSLAPGIRGDRLFMTRSARNAAATRCVEEAGFTQL